MSVIAKINENIDENFIVLDVDGNRITGLLQSDFIVELFDPDKNEVSGSITVTIVELGNGHYRASFIPNKKGSWFLTVSNTDYFPWGKSNEIDVYDASMDDLAFIKEVESGRWQIINNQMIFYASDNTTELMRFNLVDNNGDPTVDNVFDRIRV